MSFLDYGRHVGQLRRRHRAYAATSNTAKHDNHEKINSWVSFSFAWCIWGSAINEIKGDHSKRSKIVNLNTDLYRKRSFIDQ